MGSATSQLATAKRMAIDALAKHCLLDWQEGEEPPDAYVLLAGRRIAVDVVMIAGASGKRTGAPEARLREDAVVRRVLPRIENAVCLAVPVGKTFTFTINAPIREPAKLIAALTKMLLTHVESSAGQVEKKVTILGNRVQFCISEDGPRRTTAVTGFVFGNSPPLDVLVDAIRNVSAIVTAQAQKHIPPAFSGDRWLVLAGSGFAADARTYRRICSVLRLPQTFQKILMAREGERIEILMDVS
jgi:hypothetical protein